MAGSQITPPTAIQPRVFTTATAEGRARTCIAGGDFRYRRGDRVEILAAQETRQGLFYLALSPDGCAGWVPARHLAGGRRRTGALAAESEAFAVNLTEMADEIVPGAEGMPDQPV